MTITLPSSATVSSDHAVMRCCAAIAFGAVAGVVLLAVAAFVVSECFDARLIEV
jgi:hypothetical protein